ncbi:MAG: DNA gyrase inhibitor YacG [Planctomycetota bacterium]|nr:DNA gyrase inhibitor YacG [Planctomycetota bacterium]MDA1213475.1 DNA gyrase inhibitor YacG [Planctomycetota bacterium]
MIRSQSCPICKKVLPVNSAASLATFPFCSVRCRDVDLYRWSVGKYAIVEPLDPDELALNDEQTESEDDDDYES